MTTYKVTDTFGQSYYWTSDKISCPILREAIGALKALKAPYRVADNGYKVEIAD